MKKANVSNKKKRELETLKKLLTEREVIGIIDITNLPSPQLQKLRNKLKDSLQIRITKKSLIKLVLKQTEKKGIENLEKHLENCMPALLFTEKDPFKLAKLLSKNKSTLLAKAGQISPRDIKIPSGPTSFPAGPIIGELGAAGIKATIENGKVVIKEETIFVKKGEEINQKKADLLAKFKIEPIEIGLDLIAIYEKGEVFSKEVLSIDDEKVLSDMQLGVNEALNLAIYLAYPTKETIDLLLKKAESETKSLSNKLPKIEQTTPETKKEEKQKDEKTKEDDKEIKETVKETINEGNEIKEEPQKNLQNPVGYSEQDAKKAQEVINKMKDNNLNGG
jgi:large subunit ribosomal protein L10